MGLGADKIYRGRIPKEPEIYYFCQLPGGGGGPLLFLKPFRTIPVLSKHVLHLVSVAHNEIKKYKQTYLLNITRIANAVQVTL